MPKFTPPFVYVDRDTFLEDEAKYNHEIEQESVRVRVVSRMARCKGRIGKNLKF